MIILTSWLLFDNWVQKILWCHVELSIEFHRRKFYKPSLSWCQLNWFCFIILRTSIRKISANSVRFIISFIWQGGLSERDSFATCCVFTWTDYHRKITSNFKIEHCTERATNVLQTCKRLKLNSFMGHWFSSHMLCNVQVFWMML